MTKEEAIEILTRIMNNNFYGGEVQTACKIGIEALSKPSLPSNLDEAAEEWCKRNNKGIALCADGKSHYLADGMDAFKACAEWMAGQGETVTKACVIELNEDKGLHWLQMDGSNLCNALKNFNIGDKVVVQIRKK